MSFQIGLHRQFVRAAMDAPYLSREEETDLAARWRAARDQAALDRIIRAHMRLVIAIAARFRNYGLPMPDLIQEGHIGLMQAAERFDTAREVRFSTYASWWVRAAIQEYILKNWSIVRGGTSSAQKALFFNLRRLKADIARRMAEGEQLDPDREIAGQLGVSIQDVVAMQARLSGADISLNAPAGDADAQNPGERMDLLVSDAPTPDAIVAETVDGERRLSWLQMAMGSLTERERQIVHARRLEDDAATLEALGQSLGVSKERVWQIESRALEKLKAALLRLNPGFASQT